MILSFYRVDTAADGWHAGGGQLNLPTVFVGPGMSSIGLQPDRPHSARIYDHLLGGKDNFEAGRAAAPLDVAAGAGSAVAITR